MTHQLQPAYLIGLDLGKKHDYTALAVLKQRRVEARTPELHYDVIHLDRWRDRNYLDAVPAVKTVIDRASKAGRREYYASTGDAQDDHADPYIGLLVDQTGVGIAVIESLRAAGLSCIGITIHGGDAISKGQREYRVPKRELVGALQVVLQNRRLHIAEQLPFADTLLEEMDNFRATIKLTTGHDTYGAGADWRDSNHDDLVLAVAMAAWFGESQNPMRRQLQTRQLVRVMQREVAQSRGEFS